MKAKVPDASQLNGVVAPEILDAMRSASAQLSKTGVRHALIRALAVGVGLSASQQGRRLSGRRRGIRAPRRRDRHDVPRRAGQRRRRSNRSSWRASHERHLDRAVSHPAIDGDLPIAPLEALIYLKLKSPRRRDEADVIELVRIADPAPVRTHLERHAPEMLTKFDALVLEAQG